MPKVLIVDDEKSVRVTLERLLKDAGRTAFTAESIEAARSLMSGTEVDLVVCDIVLPRGSGLDLLRALRAAAPHVQVIMMTGIPTVETAAETVRAGAADYLVKPFSKEAFLRSVDNALRIKALDDERRRLEEANREHLERLARQNEELKRAAEFREQVERIVRHDLKSPLAGIIGLPEAIRTLGGLNEAQRDMLRMIEESGRMMLGMINLSLDLFRMEQGMYRFEPAPVDVREVLNEVLRHQRPLIQASGAKVVIENRPGTAGPDTPFVVDGDRLLFYSMLGNLVKNALEASPQGETVTIRLDTGDGVRTICIRNRGEIPAEIRERFFGKYATFGKKNGTGLGAYSAKLMTEAQRGAIRLDASESGATTIVLTFPWTGNAGQGGR